MSVEDMIALYYRDREAFNRRYAYRTEEIELLPIEDNQDD